MVSACRRSRWAALAIVLLQLSGAAGQRRYLLDLLPTALPTGPAAPAAPAPAAAVPAAPAPAAAVPAAPVAATPAAPAPVAAPAIPAAPTPVVAPAEPVPVPVAPADAAAAPIGAAGSGGTPVSSPAADVTVSDLTAPDGFVYDFELTDVDYIAPLAPLPHNNLTALPPLPPNIQAQIPQQLPNRMPSWTKEMLEHNKALWDAKANRRIGDGVDTLIEVAELYLLEPIYEVTNKTVAPPMREGAGAPRLRQYFSLSEHYWPSQISAVNPEGLPYTYSPSIFTRSYDITPNKRHLELTIEHVASLSLAYYFTGDRRYSSRARDKLFTWFIDPSKAMTPDLRYAAFKRANSVFSGRPEGLYDLNALTELLNGVALLELAAAPEWTSSDSEAFADWVSKYEEWVNTEPVAIYARMAANYIGTSVDEQIIACNMFLGRLERAAQVVHFSASLRMEDQIVNGELRYERDLQRSLDYTQQCLRSWVSIARMGDKLNINVWEYGLNLGHSVKDGFDQLRPHIESRGATWPREQIGTKRVRIAGELLPIMYVAYRLDDDINSGPREYIALYTTAWPSFNSSGAQARAIVSRLHSIELDSEFALEGIPLIEECDNLRCDTRTLAIWGVCLGMILLVCMCLLYNCYAHWAADRATEVPAYLRAIREQQAKYKQMNLKVAPAKPEYMEALKEEQQKAELEEALQREEEMKAKQIRKEIKQTKEKLARKRESRMQSQMQGYGGSMMPGYGQLMSTHSQFAPSLASGAGGGSSFMHEQSFMGAHAAPMGMAPGYGPGFVNPAYGVAAFPTQTQPAYAPNAVVTASPATPPQSMPGQMSYAPVSPELTAAAYGNTPPTSASGEDGGDFSFPTAAPMSPTAPGASGGFSGAAPSQSFTGILDNANALIGELGEGQTMPIQGGAAGQSGAISATPRRGGRDRKKK